MANFSKILGLGSALLFAGMAFGQSCTNATSNATFVPVEATAAQVSQLTFTCNSAAGGAMNLQVFLSPALPITSKITASSTSTTEAVASVGAIGLGNASAGVQGLLSNNSLIFNGLTLAAGANTITVSNVRVNASSIAVGNGVPPAITETVFTSGPAVVPGVLAATTVAFVQSGISSKAFRGTSAVANYTNGMLVGSPSSTPSSFVICNGYKPSSSLAGSTATVIQINENYVSAFRAASEAPQVVSINNVAINNAPATNDRLKLVFSGVPANVTLYLPVGLITSQVGGAQIQWTSSETGAFAGVTASGSSSVAVSVYGAGLAAVTVSGGTGTAVFDLKLEDLGNLDQFNIPVFIVTSPNAVAGSSTPFTVAASYAPVGSTQIPNFVVGASTTTLTGATFNLCTTSLLFPFITNQMGFDTGIAISNTSTDPFGTSGATPQAGICTLNFYGAGAPSPSAVTLPTTTAGNVVSSGNTGAVVVSTIAPGFQGYVIAQCAFQFAHGFAFITNGAGGLSEGYLAGVIPDTNQKARAADPLSAAAAGTGENLGN